LEYFATAPAAFNDESLTLTLTLTLTGGVTGAHASKRVCVLRANNIFTHAV